MSQPGDYLNDMSTPPPLDDRAVEGLLAGGLTVDDADLARLASLLAELRSVGHGAPPQPTTTLAHILAHGLPDPVDTADGRQQPTATGTPVPVRPAPSAPVWRRAAAMVAGVVAGVATQLAGLGLAGKTAFALTATAAAVVGAAATDLPQVVDNPFDRGVQHAPAGHPGDAEEGADDAADADDLDHGSVGHSPATADDAGKPTDERRRPPRGNAEGANAGDAAADGGRQGARQERPDTPARAPTPPRGGAADRHAPEHAEGGRSEGAAAHTPPTESDRPSPPPGADTPPSRRPAPHAAADGSGGVSEPREGSGSRADDRPTGPSERRP